MTWQPLVPGAPRVLSFYWAVIGRLPISLTWNRNRKMVKAARPVSQQRVERRVGRGAPTI